MHLRLIDKKDVCYNKNDILSIAEGENYECF